MYRPLKIKPLKPSEGSRERTLKALEDYQKAQAELERICKEKGIEVPVLVCAA